MTKERSAGNDRRISARTRANRQNASKSTGPKTAAGKEKSRRNALRHGLTAKTLADNALNDDMMANARSLAPADASEVVVAAIADILRPQHKLAAVRSVRAAMTTIAPMLVALAPETMTLPTWRPEPIGPGIAEGGEQGAKEGPGGRTGVAGCAGLAESDPQGATFEPATAIETSVGLQAICTAIGSNQRLLALLRRYESCAYRARAKAADHYHLLITAPAAPED